MVIPSISFLFFFPILSFTVFQCDDDEHARSSRDVIMFSSKGVDPRREERRIGILWVTSNSSFLTVVWVVDSWFFELGKAAIFRN